MQTEAKIVQEKGEIAQGPQGKIDITFENI